MSEPGKSFDSIQRARAFARVQDAAFRVPGTRWRFGLDPILGLIPGVGDVIGGSFAAYLLWIGIRVGAPAPVLARMFINIAIDALFGAIPFVGDLIDAVLKVNLRNLELLERYIAEPDRTRAGSLVWMAVLGGLLLIVLIAAVWISVASIRGFIGLFG